MPLPIIYSELHQRHAPAFEMWPGGRITDYYESPRRAEIIQDTLRAADWARLTEPESGRHDSLPLLVHEGDYVAYIREGFHEWIASKPLLPERSAPTYYPAYFPPPRWRRRAKGDERFGLATGYGFYTFDLTAPLTAGTYEAALASACCAMTAANMVLYGEPAAYALCRPPGHHAGRDFSGGYCYFNNTAIAAKILSVRGPVVALDIDCHHGNGTQDIFWEDERILTISLHCDPRVEYPYFVGFSDEVGAGGGEGYNLNIPLPPHTNGEWYLSALDLALDRIHLFNPWAMVIALGVDTYGGDPIGKFALHTADYAAVAQRLKMLKLPTVLVQEGGYNLETLGQNVAAFLKPFSS